MDLPEQGGPEQGGEEGQVRCDWAAGDSLMAAYHDQEWGVPQYDERALFEMLTLEGAQSGLSWRTILHKREGYRLAFDGFDIEAVAAFGENRVAALVADAGIVRNRLKIRSVVSNAAAIVGLWEAGECLSGRLWGFVGGRAVLNSWRSQSEIPAFTDLAGSVSKDLKSLGFRFVGPTVCYSLMQACGMVNDHLVGCFRRAEIARCAGSTRRGSTRAPG